MTPEQVLSHSPHVLSQTQRESYFEHGYAMVEKLISEDWLQRLRAVTAEFIEKSRAATESDETFDLAPSHSAEQPRLRRIKMPDGQHPTYWAFATDVIADVAADLVGPGVKFHHSKLNFKWHDGGDAVEWHQDISFYPHTNYSPLAIGVYLNDTDLARAPLAVIPGSHRADLYDQYHGGSDWAGCLSTEDVATLDLAKAVHLPGPAGSITVHNCRTVHGSPPSELDEGRPLLINAFTSADAFAYTAHPQPSVHSGEIVRGEPARWAHHDGRPCLVPPDWSGGYTSIFAAQAGEDAA